MEPLHDNEKYIFEQIKIDCFFNCSNKNLSLLNYASHLESCLGREIIKSKNTKLTSITDTVTNEINKSKYNKTTIQIDFFESGGYNKMKEHNEKLNSQIDENERIIKNLLLKVMYLKNEENDYKNNSNKMYDIFLDLDSKAEKSKIELEELTQKLQVKMKQIDSLQKRLKYEKENYLKELLAITNR